MKQLLFTLTCLVAFTVQAKAQALPPEMLLSLVKSCTPKVSPDTMLHLVDHESKGNPFVIGLNLKEGHKAFYPKTDKEAVNRAKALIKKGHNIDMGLGQINSANLSRLGMTVEDVFDPCKNLRGAATILRDAYRRTLKTEKDKQKALTQALSIYNTGKIDKGVANGYVGKVRGYEVPSLASNQDSANGAPVTVKKQPAPAWDVYGSQRTATPTDETTHPVMVFGD